MTPSWVRSGIVPTHGPEEPLMPDMCWLTETVLVARHMSMVPDAGALPPLGISLVLAAIGNFPDGGSAQRRPEPSVVAEQLPIRPQRLQTAESGASSAGLLAVILCASTRAIKDAVAPLFSAPMVDGTTRLSRLAVLALLRAQCVSGGALQLQHRDRSDAGSALRVVGEARVSARLHVVDAVALFPLELADGHGVRLRAAFDGALAGGGEVVVPVRVRPCSALGCEHVDRVVVSIVRQVHQRVDGPASTLAAAVVYEGDGRAFEVAAGTTAVGAELRDDLVVPVVRFRHLSLLVCSAVSGAAARPDGSFADGAMDDDLAVVGERQSFEVQVHDTVGVI